jgi:HAD superfamily hydrolase (TIGR01549 family)
MFSGIRVISFDLDDTLWPCGPVIQRAEQKLYDWLAEHAPEIPANYTMEAMRQHRLIFQRDNPDIAHDLTQVRQRVLQQLMELHGYPESLVAQGTALFREARNQVTPYPDVLPVLEGLLTRYKLVSVTNGNAEIDKTPLHNIFHRSFTAAEVGAARPDPALFQAVLDWFEIDPGAVLHVGDDPDRDVEPARLLGLRTAWMQRGHRQWQDAGASEPAADVIVRDLRQLAAMLNKET